MLDLACELNALDIAERIQVEGDQLVTRPVGKRFRYLLEKHLLACNTNRCILSFAKVRLVDSSFADEALVTLAAERSQRGVTWPCFLLRDLTPVSRENLDMALLSRPVRQLGLRNCVLPVILDSGEIELAGKAEEHVRQTFEALRQHRQLTARELADHNGLEISAASTRLKVVFNLGLACREETRDERGRLYVYLWAG